MDTYELIKITEGKNRMPLVSQSLKIFRIRPYFFVELIWLERGSSGSNIFMVVIFI